MNFHLNVNGHTWLSSGAVQVYLLIHSAEGELTAFLGQRKPMPGGPKEEGMELSCQFLFSAPRGSLAFGGICCHPFLSLPGVSSATSAFMGFPAAGLGPGLFHSAISSSCFQTWPGLSPMAVFSPSPGPVDLQVLIALLSFGRHLRRKPR